MTLFPQKSPAKKPGLALTLHFDGGSRGNPGPAGIGVVLLSADDKTPLYELGEFLGIRTSNYSEYTALIRGLTAAKAFNAASVEIKSDSELVVRQINGQYKVKSPDLLPLFQTARKLMDEIGNVTISHVYREKNARADELANIAMDRKTKVEPLGAPWAPNSTQNAPKPNPLEHPIPTEDGPAPTRSRTLAKLIETCKILRKIDEKLTPVELEILLQIALKPGLSTAQIGDNLQRTPAATRRTISDILITRDELVYLDNRDPSDSGADPEDRAFLTEKGERLIHQLLAALES